MVNRATFIGLGGPFHCGFWWGERTGGAYRFVYGDTPRNCIRHLQFQLFVRARLGLARPSTVIRRRRRRMWCMYEGIAGQKIRNSTTPSRTEGRPNTLREIMIPSP